MENNINDNLNQLWEKIKDVKIAMMTTCEKDGRLRSRPMYTQKTEMRDNIWFFTKDDTPKVDELQNNTQVNLSYADPDDSVYVSVSGRASVVRDKAKAAELWNPALKAWFPKGLDDPHLVLIKVEADMAEYWDSPSNRMVQLFGMVKAAISGEEYRQGENKKINL